MKTFMAGDSFCITKTRKGRPRNLDIRKLVKNIEVTEDNKLEFVISQEEGKAGSKPAEILKAVLGLTDKEGLDLHILKIWQNSSGM